MRAFRYANFGWIVLFFFLLVPLLVGPASYPIHYIRIHRHRRSPPPTTISDLAFFWHSFYHCCDFFTLFLLLTITILLLLLFFSFRRKKNSIPNACQTKFDGTTTMILLPRLIPIKLMLPRNCGQSVRSTQQYERNGVLKISFTLMHFMFQSKTTNFHQKT